ncbi:MAG: methyltransferase domain-containing protein [Desulfohalobiaceae bacterium]|nr:methyltransferase domain-containing protein [Desulfohalobiaceae bacterium]
MRTIQLSRLDLQPGQAVLDLGCGQGRHLHALYDRPGLRVYGLDRDPDVLQKAASGCRTYFPAASEGARCWLVLSGDSLRLPFAPGSLDVVICSEVLEHIRDYRAALLEIRRVLRPGGRLALSVPRHGPERVCWLLSRGYRNEPGGHLRIFRSRFLRDEVAALGFIPRGGHHAHALHTPYWWLKCLRWGKRDSWLPVRLYHRMLVWDILSSPRCTRWLEALLNPLLGKSVVFYLDKEMEAS